MSVFSCPGVRWISLGWTAFILENLVLSHNREYIIDRFGKSNYHMAYNALSTAACGSIAYGYLRHGRGKGAAIKPRGPAVLASFVLQSVGFVLLSQQAPKLQMPVVFQGQGQGVQAGNDAGRAAAPSSSSGGTSPATAPAPMFFVRCPMDFRPSDVPADGVHGTMRVSRHATFWGFGLACYGEAAAALFLPELVMFSFPLLFAAIGSTHQDYRYRRGSGGVLTPEMEQNTSNLPFLALVQGRQSWDALWRDVKWTNAGLAVGAAGMLLLRNLRRLR